MKIDIIYIYIFITLPMILGQNPGVTLLGGAGGIQESCHPWPVDAGILCRALLSPSSMA